MKKIVITGPESSGKTTLSDQLTLHFNLPFVREYARDYIDDLERPYEQADLLHIAKGQLANEQAAAARASLLLVCDTDLLTIKIWSEYKYGDCDAWISTQLNKNLPEFYLLCTPDLKWQADPQRENPKDREKLFELYKKEIEVLNVNYHVISGQGNARFEQALTIIEREH